MKIDFTHFFVCFDSNVSIYEINFKVDEFE